MRTLSEFKASLTKTNTLEQLLTCVDEVAEEKDSSDAFVLSLEMLKKRMLALQKSRAEELSLEEERINKMSVIEANHQQERYTAALTAYVGDFYRLIECRELEAPLIAMKNEINHPHRHHSYGLYNLSVQIRELAQHIHSIYSEFSTISAHENRYTNRHLVKFNARFPHVEKQYNEIKGKLANKQAAEKKVFASVKQFPALYENLAALVAKETKALQDGDETTDKSHLIVPIRQAIVIFNRYATDRFLCWHTHRNRAHAVVKTLSAVLHAKGDENQKIEYSRNYLENMLNAMHIQDKLDLDSDTPSAFLLAMRFVLDKVFTEAQKKPQHQNGHGRSQTA